jgi:hypothetical protein
MSRKVKIALIGAATVLAVIISGIFLLRTITFYQSYSSPANNSATVTSDSVTSDSADSPTSKETLTIFCNALETRNYATQYDQLSSTLQSQASEAQYAAQVGQTDKQMGGITGCTVSNVSNVSEDDLSSTATLTLTRGNGTTVDEIYTLIIENGVWKIDSIQ